MNMTLGSGMVINKAPSQETEKFFATIDGSTVGLTEIREGNDVFWDYCIIFMLISDQTGRVTLQSAPYVPYKVKANPSFPLLEIVDPMAIERFKLDYHKAKEKMRLARIGLSTPEPKIQM